MRPIVRGYKDSTKTHYVRGGPVGGPKGAAKVSQVMREFREGTLHSGSKTGPKVKNRKQAVAIALSEAKRNPMKMAEGGSVSAKTAVHKHEWQMHPGKPLTKLAHGGRTMVRSREPLIKC